MRASLSLLSLLFLFVSVSGEALEAKLRKKLFNNYDAKALPVARSGQSIVVTVRCSLTQVIQVDVLGQKIKASLWLKLGWRDQFLRWNMSEFPIDAISTPVGDVWRPDFAVYNSLKKLEHTNVEENLIIFNDGRVLVVYSIIAEVPCGMDVRAFPFDKQTCKIKMGTWTYHAGIISLNKSSTEITTEQYTPNSEWDLLTHGGKWRQLIYECCDVWLFEDITYTLILQRKPMYYMWNLVVPCITLLCIGIVAHFLDANGDRLNVCITTLLAFIVFLLMVPEILPPQADSVSRIALLFGLSIVLLGFSTVTTVVTMYLINQSELDVAFKPWQRVLFSIFGKFELCLCPKFMPKIRKLTKRSANGEVREVADKMEEEDQANDTVPDLDPEAKYGDQKALRKLEWLAFAFGFDRFCWIIFVLGCIANLMIFFI